MTNFSELMSNISQSLADKKELIFEDWKDKVRKDKEIESDDDMSEVALEDDVSELLDAIVKSVDKSDRDNSIGVAHFTLSHTEDRAKNNYSAAEIVREYQLLKRAIFEALKEDLDIVSGRDCQKIIYQIDTVLDVAISRSFNIFVEHRTKSLKEVQEEIAQTNQELNRLLEINRDHFSYLAHDLKTPLNSIMGYAQLLLRRQEKLKNEGGNQDIESINRVLHSSRELLAMVNDLLEFFRYENSGTQLRLVPFNIRLIINSTIETLEPLAEEKGLKIIKDYEDAPLEIVNDISKMMKIVSNLLSNAIRYTKKGKIIVSCKSLTDDQWLLAIKDTGIGIRSEDQERVFQPFARNLENYNEIKEGSTGLGLAIVKQLVKLLQGEIELVSEVNQGSTFKLTFPLKIANNCQD